MGILTNKKRVLKSHMNHSWGSKIWIVLVVLVIACWGQSLQAQGGFTRYAGEFLNLETSARVQALGGAGTVLQQDVSTMGYNPASLITLPGFQITLMHAWQFVEFVNFDFAALGYRLDDQRVIGVSVSRLGVENILDTRQAQVFYGDSWRLDWSRIARFSTADYVVTIALAQRSPRWGNVGGAIRMVYRDFGDVQAWGIGLDIGGQWQLNSRWQVAAVIRNVTTTIINWSNGTREFVAPQLRVGTAYQIPLQKLNSQLLPVVELTANTIKQTTRTDQGGLRNSLLALQGGLEWQYRQTLSLRAGMDDLGRFTAGVGLQIPHIRFDYAFLSFTDELGNAHRVGLVVSF